MKEYNILSADCYTKLGSRAVVSLRTAQYIIHLRTWNQAVVGNLVSNFSTA